MKLAIMSDFHFGYGAGTELEQDAYDAVRQALEMSSDCSLILMPGDLFDTRVPGTETLAKAMQLMIKPSLSRGGARFVKVIGKDGSSISPRSLSGIPIITIHGTHERRTKEFMNPVQALETAGFAVHLHCNGVVFEKDGEKVAVFGLSGVPDQYAEAELKAWNPKPEPGCYNIFMLHQNIREFMCDKIEHALSKDDLPEGFDMYVCGHIHEARKAEKGGRPFVFPGSLIPTQLSGESTKPRGFFIVNTKSGSVDFAELEGQRKVFVIEADNKDDIKSGIEQALSGNHAKKPLIRIRLPPDFEEGAISELRHKYGERAIMSFKQDNAAQPEAARTLEEHVLSVQELGKELLEKNLSSFGLDTSLYESLFELIAEGRYEDAERLVLGNENKRAIKAENANNQPWQSLMPQKKR